MITRFREHYASYPEENFYISGAPQCEIPDAQLGYAIDHAAFDFIWVQFYNTPSCSAASYFDLTDGFNFDAWVAVVLSSANPSAKHFENLM